MNLIAKPSKENIKTYVPIGLFLVSLSFFDVFINAFFNFNLNFPPNGSFRQIFRANSKNKKNGPIFGAGAQHGAKNRSIWQVFWLPSKLAKISGGNLRPNFQI